MNALRLAAKGAVAPARVQSRNMVSRTAPALGMQDPFEHPHLVWEHLGGKTENHFSAGPAAACTFGLAFTGVYLVMSAVWHQNKKHGFTK